jgi:hypothetical protein
MVITCVMGVWFSHLIEGLWNRDTRYALVLLVFMRVFVDCVNFSCFFVRLVVLFVFSY